MEKRYLHLKYGLDIIAKLEITGSDQPWLYCNFLPLENYDKHKDFFTKVNEERSSVNVDDFDTFLENIITSGYSLVGKNYQYSKFIIIFKKDNEVVVRGKRVKIT